MIVVLYKWRVDPSKEAVFIENWAVVTRHYLEHCGSLGSRLHRGSDGLFYGYAKWPDNETRERAFLDVRVELARLHMQDSVTESFPVTFLDVVADHLADGPIPHE